ncbi:bone marrow proteoglycan isoform X2 [Carlito syrichta]|uniref:Bone marrow proteoglycan isoform X2 n=1 Tax=Carlito syrichta TaxID=1868482 RepID=A0A1U7T1I4_CARSF|nr:bone marrow proteoglycan isoform X2 [Carlito syrichta]
MKLPLLLALLFGAVSALHLNAETADFESPSEAKSLPEDGEMPARGAEETPSGELALLEEEEGGGSGDEDDPEEETLDETDGDLQCPKEEDTVKLVGSPGCKPCRRYLLHICRKCYRGNLVSIHSFSFNYRLQCSVSVLNQGQVWIGGRITGWAFCKRFRWVDGSRWNFAYWAAGQPWASRGRCVTLCTRGGRWRRSHCGRRRPFICSY